MTKADKDISMICGGQVENEERDRDGAHSYVEVVTKGGKKGSDKVKKKKELDGKKEQEGEPKERRAAY